MSDSPPAPESRDKEESRDKNRPRRGFSRRAGQLLLSLIVSASLVQGGWLLVRNQVYDRPASLNEARTVTVPRGSTAEVAQSLAAQGVVDSPLMFRLAAFLVHGEGSLRPGEFSVPPHLTLSQTLALLRTGRPVQHKVTIPEGLTAKQIVALLDRAEALSGEVKLNAEGIVLPQTYVYERGMTREAIVERARAAMDHALTEAWANRAPNLPLSSPRDAVTLASIVERETSRPEERPHVAAVYLNRLRQGMKLQSDPTVVYAASGGAGVMDHPIRRSELNSEDPYNTYKFAGLPPGPIASPGIASIRAVLEPLDSDDLYFVADGTGGHVFSKTLESHSRNVTKLRSLENAPKSN